MRDFLDIPLTGGIDAALDAVPKTPGVLQIIDPGGGVLLTGMAANMRSWAATRLGRGRPTKPGRRPPLDLSEVARALRCRETSSSFQQRLVFERLMAHVPLAARKDLKQPAWLHLDPGERFPRLSVRPGTAPLEGLFGPFRDARTAERAREDVQRLFPIRPCDYVFEPAPDLDLGLRCVFAQVATCAAPCLQRTSEDEYRKLCRSVLHVLAGDAARPETLGWPEHVGARHGYRAVIAEAGREGLELYPLVAGRVLEERACVAQADALDSALEGLVPSGDPPASDPADDWPWLLAWLAPARCKGRLFPVTPDQPLAALAQRIRSALKA